MSFLRIAFQTNPSGVVAEISDKINGTRSIELDNAFYIQDGYWLESITISSSVPINVEAIFGTISGASIYHHKPVPSGPTETDIHRVLYTANESYPYLLEQLLIQEVIPNRIVIRRNHAAVVATTRSWDQFQEVADDVKEKFGAFDLESVDEIEEPGEPLDTGHLSEVIVTKLSDSQITTLETAYDMGYFDVPRSVAAQDVAAALDVSQATFSERIRTAERQLFELIFGAQNDH